jgi:type I restriction enzyme S subunit
LSKLKIGYVALSEVADVRFSSVDKHTVASERPVRLCNYTDVFKNRFISNSMDFMSASATESEIERFGLRHGDIAITKDSETPDEIGIPALVERPASDLVLGYHLALVRAKPERCDPYFLSAALQTRYVARHYLRTAVGLTRFGLSIRAVADTPVPNLPLSSQKRIGRWYREAARMESHTDALIAAKREQKRGLMQQLLTGKVRFPGFAEPWKTVAIGDLLEEHARKVEWDDDKVYRLISIRRRNGGVFPREALPGSKILTKSLFAVEAGDLLISCRQVVHGAFAVVPAEHGGSCISGEYLCLRERPGAQIDSRFFNLIAHLPAMRKLTLNCSYGVHIEKLNLDVAKFMRSKLCIAPTLEEQIRIVRVFSALDQQLALLQEQRAAMAAQRRGLMERLLSGEIEVPSTDTCAA